MKTTKLGETLKILRIKNHEVLADMAQKLDTSASFLCAIENGKKNIPKNWADKISKEYNLSPEETQELVDAIAESQVYYKIDCKNAGVKQRQVVALFAKEFCNLSDAKAIQILKILENQN